VKRLSKRLGGLRTDQAIEAIEAGNHAEWIANLLIYYDKTYEFDLDKHEDNKRIQLDLIGINPIQAVPILLKTKTKFYGKHANQTD